MTRKVYAILVITFLALLGLGLHSHQHFKQLCRNNQKSITVRDLRTIMEPSSSLETASLCPEVKGSARTTTKEAKTTEVTPAAVDQTVSDATRFKGETDEVSVIVRAEQGVFPAGTEMRVAPVSAKTTMAAVQKQCDDEQEVVDAVATDITFWLDGREIQPDGDVIVSMYAKRNVEGETHEAVTVRHDGIAEVMGDACGNMGAFTTDHFTVYAIVGKTYGGRNMTKYARQVYNFYLDGILIQTQIVKDGDALSAPPAPGGYSKKEFIGWFKENTDTEFPFGTVSIPSTQTTNDTFRIDARFKDLYKATFYANPDKSVVFQVKSAEDGQQVSTDDVVMPDSIHTVSVYKIFDGWKGLDGNVVADDTTIAGADIELVPNFVKGNWVFFDSRGGSAVREQLVEEEGTATEPDAPVREGYTFLGWEILNAADNTYGDFDFGTAITNTTTLFARWQANTSRYKLRIWHENADDENYTLVDSMYREGNVGEDIPFDELLQTFTRDKYEGFHLNNTALPTWFNNISNFTRQFNYQAEYSIFDYDEIGPDQGWGERLRDSTNTDRYLFTVNADGDTTYFFRWYIEPSYGDTVWTNDTIKVFDYYDAGAYIDLGSPFLVTHHNAMGAALVDTTGGNVTIRETDGDVTIHEDGSTVVNIYYSRDTYRFLFRFGRVNCENCNGRVWDQAFPHGYRNDYGEWVESYYNYDQYHQWIEECIDNYDSIWHAYDAANSSGNEDNSRMAYSKLVRSEYQRSLNHFHINPHHNFYSNYMMDKRYWNESQNKWVEPKYWEMNYQGLPKVKDQYRYTDLWNTAMSVKYGENLYRAIQNMNSNYHSSSDQPIETRAKVGYFIDDADWAWYADWKEGNLGCNFTPYENMVEINPTKDNQITFDGNFLKNADGTPQYPHGSEVQMVLRRFDMDGFMQRRHPYIYYYQGLPDGITGELSNSYYNKTQTDTSVSKTIGGENYSFASMDKKILWGTPYYAESAWINQPREGFTTVLAENYKSTSTAIYPDTTTVMSGAPQLWNFFSRDDEWQSIPYRMFQYNFVPGSNNKIIQDTTYSNNTTDSVVHPTISFYNIRNQYPVKFMDGETVLVDSLFYYEQYLNLNQHDSLHVIALNHIDGTVLKGDKVTKHENGISYRFDSWYTDPQYVYPATYPTTMPYHELTYYAKWVPDSVAVTFHFENGEGDTTIMVKYDNACALPDAPVWEGHSFIRWEDANGIAFNENGTMLKDTNVYARWSTFFTYAVRYNAGTAGTFSTETDPCTYLEGAYAATLGTAVPNNPADTVFSGWRIGNSSIILTKGLFAINSTNDEADTKDSVITLNAVYAPVPRPVTQITYHANYPTKSATDTTIAQDYIINDDYIITEDNNSLNYSMDGYRFAAWSPVAAPSVLDASDPDRVLFFPNDTIALEKADNVLYAVWIPKKKLYVNKVWDDNNNQENLRPESVSVKVMADGESVGTLSFSSTKLLDSITVDAAGPMGAISYTIEETDVPFGYNATYSSNATEDTLTVTNTLVTKPDITKRVDNNESTILGSWYQPFTYSISTTIPEMSGVNSFVISDTLDNNLTFSSTPVVTIGGATVSCATISGQVLKVTVPTDYLTSHQGQAVSISFQAKFKEGITYANLSSYTDNAVPNKASYKINNLVADETGFVYVTPAVITFKGTKTWADNDNRAGKRPNSITVQIKNGDEVVETITCTPAGGVWNYTSQALPVFNAAGDSIQYSVVETAVNEYEDPVYAAPDTNDATKEITVNITNTYVEEPVTVSVNKVWNDENNQDGVRPSSVQAQLYADGAVVDEPKTLDETNHWSYTWEGLDKYRSGKVGEEIVYSVREFGEVDGKIASLGEREYTVSYSLNEVPHNGSVTITNTYVPDSIEVLVEKIWNDQNNNDGFRPTSIEVQLLAGTYPIVTLSEANNWKGSFGLMPRFEDGYEISYFVAEQEVDKYNTLVMYNNNIDNTVCNVMVTNKHVSETVNLTVYKHWDDNNNADGLRTPVTVQLYSTLDGTLTFEDDSDNEGWTLRGEKLIESITDYASATWENMPKYYHGTLIRYAVCEKVTPTDYVRSYSNGNELTAANGYIDTITNLHKSPVEVTLEAAKKITNRAWFETDTFAMALFAHPKTNPMPEISGVNNGTPFSEVRITSTDSVVSDSVRFDTFSPILFTLDDLEGKTDSVFHYTIREMPPATTGLSVIPGITYSAKRFDVEIHLSRDNHDSLQYAVTYWATTTVDGEEVRDSVVQYPVFINQYDEQSSLYHPSANKSLAFMGNHSLKNREFQFEMRPAGQHATIAPMPGHTVGTGINRVLTVYNTGNEVRFFEDNEDGLLFRYVDLIENFTNEQLYAGVNFSYEMREVIPDDAVNHNDGTMSKKVGDVETFYDAVVHYRQLHVKIEDAPGEVIMLVVTPVENTVLQEFYLKDNGDTVLVERGTLASELRHNSTAPIFRNVRIVDTTVTVKKSWVDYNNTLSLRPDSVIVKLLADGDSINYAVLKADNDWEHSFSGLPTAKLNDTLGLDTIHYSIAEVEVSNYYSAVQRHTSNIYHFSVTNTLDSNIVKKDTSILVRKTWVDPDGTEHPDITILLKRNSVQVDEVTLTNGETEHTFANLPYYNVYVNGKVIVTNSPLHAFNYTIEEPSVSGYSTTIDGGHITNTIRQKFMNIAGTKTWIAPAGIALPNATIVLTRDGVKLDSVVLTSGATSYSFTGLPKYDVITNNAVIDQGDGHLFEYAVLERPVEGYSSVQNGNNFTNTINQEWIEIPVSKVWDDLSNNDGFRPESVTLQLTGTTAASTVHYTLDVVGTGDQWDTTFKELPKYDDARNVYTYTLSEPVTPQDYEQSVTEYTVTNSYTPDSMNLTVYKFWDDNDNNDGLREPVKVVLYQTTDETLVFDPDSDNEGWTVVGDTVTIPVCTETTNPWGCYVVWPVPVYNAGKEIRYAVKEVTTIDNYVTTYESGGLIIRANDNMEVITNRHKSPVNVALEVQKKIRGRAWFETDTFAMALNPTNNENPMPTDATLISGIPYSMIKVFSTQTAVNDSVRQNSFGDITFTMDDLEGKSDSTFIYRIFELAPAASGLTDIPGMTYSGTVYQVEVTISEVASKSSLQSSIAYYVIHSDESKTPADLTLFTNIYNDSLVTYKINAYKSLVAYDAPALSDDEFSFTLKPVGENAAIAPMPDGTVGMGANRSLTVRNEGVNVEFFDDDISGDGLRFDYEELRALGFSDEDLTDGIRFEYEMSEDNIPANAVFNSGNYTYSLNADGITTYYDAVVHHRTILVKMKEVNDKVVLAADAEQSVHRDYYLNGSDTTWLTNTNDIRYTKRHGYGGVPIFCNFRIADTAVTVTKEWIDGENVEELRPEFVTITLMADGENTGLTPTLNTDNNWSYRFTGLPTAVLNNTLGFDTIVYTVEETQVDHYLAPEYSGNMRDGLVVTNTLEPIFIDIPVTKIWEDDRNNDGFRPDSVTLTLEGTTANDTVTFTRKMGGIVEAENWTDDQWDTVFTGLPKYDDDLAPYQYTLTEEEVQAYTTDITGNAMEGFTVTNTHADSMITFIIRKVWVDNDDQDGIRPNTVYGSVSSQYGDDFFFALYDDMDFIQESHPMHKYYKRNLNTIVLTEFPVPDGYEVSYSGSAETGEFVITNTHVPDSVRITVDKIWDDRFNNDGIRPASISVNLYANGDSVDTRTITGTGHEWEADFGKWPVMSDGDSIEYSLSETWVPGYQAPSNVQLITETEGVYKLRITNVHKPDSIDLTVVKVWNDLGITDGRSNVQLQLFRCYDNTAFDPVLVSITGDTHWAPVGDLKILSTEEDTIPVTWNRLPQFYQGDTVRYAVKEIGSPDQYTTTYVFGGELTEGNHYTDTVINTRIEASTTSVLAVQKKLTGREWLDSDIFEMALIPERSTQPMPNTVGNVNGIVYAPLFITNDSTAVNDSVRLGTFEPITFNLTDLGGASSKTFLYHIRELTATESSLDRIIGVTYGSERYEVNVTVEFANNTLAVTDVAVYPIHHNTVDNVISEYRGDRLAGNPTITNRYNDSVTIYRMVADKQLTIIGLEDTLRNGDYHFMLKPVGDNAALAPMPENTTGTGVNRTLTVSNEGNAVRFYDDDTEEDGLRFDYEELIAAGFTDAQLLEGIGFEYELQEIIPTDVTYIGNGFWSRSVTNSDGIMEDEIYDGLIHYRNIVVKMQEIDGKVVLNLTSGNNDRLDYYLDAEGNQHYLSHDDATFAQRHGTGGVPIFRNGRIARLNIAVEKVWDDYDNALDTRPESITVTLLANGVATDNVATLNEDNGWAYTFENLQASQPATGIIEYSVVEGDVAHYTATYSGDMTEGFFILNTLVDYGEDDDCTISVERSQLSSCPAIDCSPVTDAAGITYQTVKVDGYCWMAENLRTPTANAMVYQSVISPNTDANLATYGYLYTWHDAAGGTNNPEPIDGYVRGVCPNGWHLPTAKEINVLMTNSSDALRSESYWAIPAEGANSTGFNALPAGYYNAAAQRFEGLHSTTLFHGDTPNSVFSIDYYCCKITPNQQTLQNGYSVRCVKDCE